VREVHKAKAIDSREIKVSKYMNVILSFRTLSIVLVLKNKLREHDVSETGSVSVLRCGKNPIAGQ
jgi:hypothetical protein